MSILENTLDGTNMPETNTNISNFNTEETNMDTTEIKDSSSSDCNVCKMLETISAPDLKNSNYGKDIEDVFSNIDSNFTKLANHDFIKGENGDTIGIEYVNLNNEENGIGKDLYDALKRVLITGSPKLVDKKSWDYDINNYKVPLVVISNIDIGKKEYIGSASPLLFIDYRFSSNVLESVSQDSYEDVTNLSCIVNFKYSNNVWVCEIDKSFPRIQYNKDKKYFEWLLNNEGSTIQATGIKGDKGEKLIMHFKDVDINTKTTSNTFEVPYNKEEIISEGDPVLLYLYDEANYKGYYISYIKSIDEGNKKFEVEYNENYVNKLDFAKNTYEFFKSLNINNTKENTPAQGIFLPFNNTDKNAHVIYNNSDTLNICAVDNYMDFANPISSNINISADDIAINGSLTVSSKDDHSQSGYSTSLKTSPESLQIYNGNNEDEGSMIEFENGAINITSNNRGGINITSNNSLSNNCISINRSLRVSSEDGRTGYLTSLTASPESLRIYNKNDNDEASAIELEDGAIRINGPIQCDSIDAGQESIRCGGIYCDRISLDVGGCSSTDEAQEVLKHSITTNFYSYRVKINADSTDSTIKLNIANGVSFCIVHLVVKTDSSTQKPVSVQAKFGNNAYADAWFTKADGTYSKTIYVDNSVVGNKSDVTIIDMIISRWENNFAAISGTWVDKTSAGIICS